jgi:hypothetical protein
MADGDRIRIGQGNIASNPGAETLLRRAGNSTRTDPVFTVRTPVRGDGIHGEASGERTGVHGTSPSGFGARGTSRDGNGVRGSSSSSFGVAGDSFTGSGVGGSSNSRPGVDGFSFTSSGVRGISNSGAGMEGFTSSGVGVRGSTSSGVAGVAGIGTFFGVAGDSPGGMAVSGVSSSGFGVRGFSVSNFGVVGVSTTSTGASGISTSGAGASGLSVSGFGVTGRSTSGTGVSGTSTSGTGVTGSSSTSGSGVSGSSTSGAGVSGTSTTGTGVFGRGPFFSFRGGVFDGGITVFNGLKLFKIDHPLDPENRYLLHTCVESSEMKNVYDGVARLDEDGSAWVELPEWFDALNGDFRYQLTAVGGSAPDLHVAEELSENRFKIGGGQGGMKVCWQVTGSRKDPSAAAHPFEVEQEKREEERGRYLEPGLYDAPEEQRVMMGRMPEAVEEEQRPPELSGIDFALEEERLRQLDEWRRLVEEQRREAAPPSLDFVRLEEEKLRQLDEWRRLMEEQRRETEGLLRRMEGQAEAPPEGT